MAVSRGRKRRPKGAGSVRQLPSRRWQASIIGPDGERHNAPDTFDTKMDADAWLADQVSDLEVGLWEPPRKTVVGSVREYAEEWISTRPLAPKTRSEYEGLLKRRILPELGSVPLTRLTPAMIRRWHAAQGDQAPTDTAKAYGLLHAICHTAMDDELLPSNPCRIRGAAISKSRRVIVPATPEQVEVIAAAMPARYRAMVLLSAWCTFRSGEVREIRRADVAVDGSKVTVSRAVGSVPGQGFIVGDPKSEAGKRTVTVPPHIRGEVVDHLALHTGPDPDALLFPSAGDPTRHLAYSSLYKVFYPAREKAGRPDLHWHDLRHTSGTLATTRGGATLRETMARLGHSTPSAAMIYQHASEERDEEIAENLSAHALADRQKRARRKARPDDDEGNEG